MNFNKVFDSRRRASEIVHFETGLDPSTRLVVIRTRCIPSAS